MIHDYLIKNGWILDGSGNPWYRAALAIQGQRIVFIGNSSSTQAKRVIDAAGLIVAPGFIDIHQHSEIHLLIHPQAESLLKQGITTVLCGNCGWSAAPISEHNRGLVHSPWWPHEISPTWRTFDQFFKIYETLGLAVNVANLVGHGWIRGAVMGWEARPPLPAELEEMKTLTAQAMEDGVFGLSTGLSYPPGCWSEPPEVIELCKIVAKYGGFYVTHDRGGEWPQGKQEAIQCAKDAALPLHISHIETHLGSWGRQKEALNLVQRARLKGMDVTFDVCTTRYGGGWLLSSLLPFWAYEGGAPKILARLQDSTTRKKIVTDLRLKPPDFWRDIILLGSYVHPQIIGMNLAEIAELWNLPPWTAAINILIDEGTQLVEVDCAMKGHAPSDLEETITQPTCMPITDSWLPTSLGVIGRHAPHPRGYGGFTIVFRKWVRGETRNTMPEEPGAQILTLTDAVRKMTSLPAQRMGLHDRGLLKEGNIADVILFNPQTLTDKAPYPNAENRRPHLYSEGVRYLFVNGNLVLDRGECLPVLSGKVLRGPGYCLAR